MINKILSFVLSIASFTPVYVLMFIFWNDFVKEKLRR